MGVVDTHMHLWDRTRFRYPWLESADAAGLPASYGAAEWRRDTAAVELAGIVHVQAEVDHASDPVAETAWMQQLHDVEGMPTACVGYADLRSDALGDVLDRHAAYPVFRGIRQEAWFDPRSERADVPRINLLDDPAFLRGLQELERRDLVFELLVWQEQLEQAAALLREAPDLRVVIDHTGVPKDEARREQWAHGLTAVLQAAPRGILKISGLGMVDAAWTPERIDPLIARALELAGPARVVFASNFPVEPEGVSYAQVWETFERAIAGFDPAERAAMLRDTATACYDLTR